MNEEESSSDAAFRESISSSGFKPNAGGIRFGAAKPKILVAGAYKVIRTAAERAREIVGKGR